MSYQSKQISLTKMTVNGKTFTCSSVLDTIFNINNLGPVPAIKIGFHLEPKVFIPDFDDIKNSKAWILTPYPDGSPKIRVLIDETTEYDISYDHSGARYDSPIIFQRIQAKSKKVTIPPLYNQSPYRIEFYPLYGNDSTVWGKDWTEKVLNKYHFPDKNPQINSDGYSDDPYTGDHLYNSQYYRVKPEDDKMKIQILAVDHPDIKDNLIITGVENLVLSIYYPQKDNIPDDLVYLNTPSYKLEKYYNTQVI